MKSLNNLNLVWKDIRKDSKNQWEEAIFFYNGVNLFYDKLHKISLNRGGSYIDSPKCLINKKATINPRNNDDKCFQYALTVALNY